MAGTPTRALFGALICFGILSRQAGAGEPCKGQPACEPGYQWVEETVYKEVERHVCKLVPDVKKVKKIVYATKDDPFCLRRPSHGKSKDRGCDGDCGGTGCFKCKGPYKHCILVKTEITVEEKTMKCVTETVIEKVPCVVRRKVPCPSTQLPPAAGSVTEEKK